MRQRLHILLGILLALERLAHRLYRAADVPDFVLPQVGRVDAFAAAMADSDVAAMVDTNTRLHLLIASASRNKYFIDCYRRILADHERIAQLWYGHTLQHNDQRTNQQILSQHRELLQAIVERDQERAERVSLAHADLCKDGVQALLNSGAETLSDLVISAEQERQWARRADADASG